MNSPLTVDRTSPVRLVLVVCDDFPRFQLGNAIRGNDQDSRQFETELFATFLLEASKTL